MATSAAILLETTSIDAGKIRFKVCSLKYITSNDKLLDYHKTNLYKCASTFTRIAKTTDLLRIAALSRSSVESYRLSWKNAYLFFAMEPVLLVFQDKSYILQELQFLG
jgi:hypothetical protein